MSVESNAVLVMIKFSLGVLAAVVAVVALIAWLLLR